MGSYPSVVTYQIAFLDLLNISFLGISVDSLASVCVFAVEENGRVFGRSKVDVIQDNFSISVQRNLNLIKCWLMNTLKNVYRNSASHS